MKTRPDFHVESPFMLLTDVELGDRVVQSYRLEEISFGWAKRGHNGQPILRSWAEECWRWWWRHVRDTNEETR